MLIMDQKKTIGDRKKTMTYFKGFNTQNCYWRIKRETSYLTHYFLCQTEVWSLSYDLFFVSKNHTSLSVTYSLWDMDTLSGT